MNTVQAFIERELKSGKRSNRLLHEKSPYLLQHAFNPVDWYPWGDDAFAKARAEDKPIFLSIGYSTCYWCHVMEREVFENAAIAALMNEKLVCIKVDREERPDIDHIYMTAVQALTGSGGWPMSVFLTHERKPFYGGTYFPPAPQYGRPSFPQIVGRISELWRTDRQNILHSSNEITRHLEEYAHVGKEGNGGDTLKAESAIERSFAILARTYDAAHGGFGNAPKFPRPVSFDFLLRYYDRTGNAKARDMTLASLKKMANGGMYDQIGGGFHRYSVDAQWRVPHFEKMLYDQAQLVNSYLAAYQISHDEFYAATARDVLEYVLRSMTHPDGGFYSAEDAESAYDPERPHEKEEGVFYLWVRDEIEQILGLDAARVVAYHYDVRPDGNAFADPQGVFRDQNILYAAHTLDETAQNFNRPPGEIQTLLDAARTKLFAAREKRPHPHLDDKILTSWNGQMISAFARAAQVLGNERYLRAAENAAQFVTTRLSDGTMLYRRWREGERRFGASLQDYSFLIAGLLDLFEASFDFIWFDTALALSEKQNELFHDPTDGGYFDTAAGDTTLLFRMKEDYDGAEPAGNSVAAMNLLRLAHITADEKWSALAEEIFSVFRSRLEGIPEALPHMLAALLWKLGTPKEIIIAGKRDADDTRQLLAEVHAQYVPNKSVLLADGGPGQERLAAFLPFISEMTMIGGRATAYICEKYACQLPVTDRDAVARMLERQMEETGQRK